MPLQKHFLNASSILSNYKDKISAVIDKSFVSIRAILPVDDINVVI